MRKTQVLIWLGCLLIGTAIYLDEFTNFPKYLSYPFLPTGFIFMFWGLRETRQSPQNRKPLSERARHKMFAGMLALVTVACIGSLYLSGRSNPNLSFGTNVVIALLTLALCAGILYWRLYRRPIEADLDRFPKRRFILLAIALVCGVLAEVFAIIDRDSEATRNVNREISDALQKWRTTPAGIQRGEQLVRLLRAIDSSHAPPDVQRALGEYADALDHGVTVLKAGVGSAEVDREIADKKTALDRAIQKHL